MTFFERLKKNYNIRKLGFAGEDDKGATRFTDVAYGAGVVAGIVVGATAAVALATIGGVLPFLVTGAAFMGHYADRIEGPGSFALTLGTGLTMPVWGGFLLAHAAVLRAGQLADAYIDTRAQTDEAPAASNTNGLVTQVISETSPLAAAKDLRTPFQKYSEMSPDGPAPKRDYKPLLRITM